MEKISQNSRAVDAELSELVDVVKSVAEAASATNGPMLSFTQQLQQCTRGTKNRPLSRLLSPLHSEPQSPIYATPPHSPFSDIAAPSSPLAANALLFHSSIHSTNLQFPKVQSASCNLHCWDVHSHIIPSCWSLPSQRTSRLARCPSLDAAASHPLIKYFSAWKTNTFIVAAVLDLEGLLHPKTS
ncbi:hypothetical protein PR048_012990 [Dryococelus australis]|uniref:Uncharacterized protein n=1 Tax=Dryococelus australis TaxID=614101 RepID=A0ABQ9HSD4_9NEOP|nr:hypothetical protein PR048_012990 [Dryococelus australis]